MLSLKVPAILLAALSAARFLTASAAFWNEFCAPVKAIYVIIINGKDRGLVMPVTVRPNHFVADGYLVANAFRLLDKEIQSFAGHKSADSS